MYRLQVSAQFTPVLNPLAYTDQMSMQDTHMEVASQASVVTGNLTVLG